MKHQRVTPFRWVRRVPGRVYRNTTVRLFVLGIVGWEVAYWIAWLSAGRPDGSFMDAASMLIALAIWAVLAVINFIEYRKARKWHAKGEHEWLKAIVAKTELLHGRYKAIPGPDDKWAVRCMCGDFLGTTDRPIMGSDSKLVPLYEEHCTKKVREILTELDKTMVTHGR